MRESENKPVQKTIQSVLKKLIQQLTATKEKKVLLENFLSLSVLQVASYMLPLLTLPYLARVLTPDQFGLIAFAGAIIQYFMVATDYGFNLSATREISVNRDNPQKVSEIYSAVIAIKLIFSLIGFAILGALIFAFDKIRSELLIYLYTYGMAIGNALFPQWFFQGMERMKYITMLNVTGKIAFTVAIFVFIRSRNDYILVPLITSIGFIFTGIASLIVVHRSFSIRLVLPSCGHLNHQLQAGWHVFISTVAVNIYTTSHTVILGIFANNTVVGYYSAGEKIIRAAQQLLGPISQTLYPRISNMAHTSKEAALRFLNKVTILVAIGTFILSILIFIFSPQIVKLLLGHQFVNSIIVIRILAFQPFVIGVATMYATLFLLGFGYTLVWTRIILIGAAIDIIVMFLFIGYFQLSYIGISIAWVVTEVSILFMSYYAYRKRVHGYRGLLLRTSSK